SGATDGGSDRKRKLDEAVAYRVPARGPRGRRGNFARRALRSVLPADSRPASGHGDAAPRQPRALRDLERRPDPGRAGVLAMVHRALRRARALPGAARAAAAAGSLSPAAHARFVLLPGARVLVSAVRAGRIPGRRRDPARRVARRARPALPAAAPAGGRRRDGARRGADRGNGPASPLERSRDRRRRRRKRLRLAGGRRGERLGGDPRVALPRGGRPAGGNRGEREGRRGHPGAGGNVLAGPDLGGDSGRLAGGPARLAFAVRDDDRKTALPDRGGSPAAGGAATAVPAPRRLRQARVR